MPVTVPKFIGARVRRKEDPRLITGRATYTDDIVLPRMAYVKLVRSTQAHAKLTKVDVAAAKQMPGVIAVVTGEDIKDRIAPLPVAHKIPDLKVPAHTALAMGEVRHVGEAIVAIVADTAAQATDAAEHVVVDYEPLPAVTDVEQAAAGAPFVHADLGTNVAFTFPFKAGDPDAQLAKAPVKIRQRIMNQRLIPVAIEPRCVIADYDAGYQKLTLTSTTQIPHLLRLLLGAVLSLPEHKIRVVAPEVGGGFGSKLNLYPEEPLLAHLSQRLGRPVKWTETRTEGFLATIHGRDQLAEVEVGAGKDGRLLALKVKLWQDLGAYHQLLTPVIPTLTVLMLPGCYTVKDVAVELKGVFTDKTPTDAYRGAGRPEATFIIERVMDLIAAATGKDPAEVRRLNFPAANAFPYLTATGLTYDSGNYQGTLDKLLEKAHYAKLRKEQAEQRAKGALMGIGLSTYVEVCGLGPSAAMPAGGWEACELEVRRSGKVVVKTGASPHGQGEETTFAQIVADGFGLTPDDVEIVHGDTDAVAEGIGTFGSRAQAVGGAALARCVETVRTKARRIAAHLLEASVEDIIFEDGKLFPTGVPAKAKTFMDIVNVAYLADQLPQEIEPGLSAVHFFEPTNFTFPFGAHLAVVDVDKDTGKVTLRRYVAVDDCGTLINPMIVEGQLHGGIAQGVAQALFEEAVYDAGGQLVTGELMDYAVPKAAFLPSWELDHTVTPTPVNVLGAKGVGEAGTIASGAAIMNAVVDALQPYGVKHMDMPATAQKVWRAMQGGAK
ncbi:MAG: carbon monoxide dehydrogenase [Gemmatimonadetes bacterium GWC2_71_9]|nr:MAG: carbon monoxide dehydrogenase [Gemmatimonadetes bacterium GWC2_71_9]OGT96991.1 MAG: carbon monoxide dehydrogenase [Gemmatimonadetes bacterium RIFCSPLOWO2_02_FULL_71_11]